MAVDFFLKGGLLMWPLLLCLLAAAFVVVERALWWWSLKRRQQPKSLAQVFDSISSGEFDRALQIARSADDPYLQTLERPLLLARSYAAPRH